MAKKDRKTASTDPTKRILVVVTSAGSYEKVGYRTGLWLGELTHFHDVVEKAGHAVVIASVAGGRVPIDPESLGSLVLKMGGTQERYEDPAYMALLENTLSLDEVADQQFDAIYLAGGHGTMFDFPHSDALGRLIVDTWQRDGIVSAVCHGPAGLITVRLPDGTALIKGRKLTGFSWAEEKLAGRDQAVPFRLDEQLKAQGAKYTKALRPMAEKVVRDGNLVTGQNPMSAKGVAEEVVKLLARS
ncbi:type 1 glutamine amidotransferase domain-containing protein [Aestuariimicrobium ganziense]|uniref:type 1 glutamine amidotransferase domain-containing protein n=1 Tax=Aestuariimicrobium ganziense TaxID=2773677 RepID=UPI00194258E7|nr:type 1 glutamine amidotransferase domain-containing protein [Aestuariimicrobium ganziense]